MHVWVLETSQRDDEYCEHNSNIVAIYSKSNYRKAMKHFTAICDRNKMENCEIEKWKNEQGYHFSASLDHYKGFKMNYVGLKKIEVQ